MSLIDKFFLYNMPPEEAEDENDNDSHSRAEELRRRLYQSYFTTSYGGPGTLPRPGLSAGNRSNNQLGGEYDDARNTAEAEWVDGDAVFDEDADFDDGYGGGGNSTDQEDAMLMTEGEKERFAAHLSSLEQREGSPHVFDASSEGLRRSKSGERASSTMYERNFRWKQRLQEHTELLRDEISADAAKDCTFSPAINRKPAGRTASGEAAPPHREPVEERLQKVEAKKNARLDELRRSVSQQQVKGCTFRPRVVRSAWVQHVTPRYLDDAKNPLEKAGDDPALAHCSFTPVTNKRVAGGISETTSAYLAAPAHDRLSRDAATKILKQRDHETTVSSIGAATATSSCAGSRKIAPKNGFFERMKEMEAKNAKSREKLEQELRVATPFKPVLATYRPPFQEQGSSKETEKHHYHVDCAAAAVKDKDEFTGRPEINPASRKLTRTVDDLHNSLRVRRSKIKKLERQQKDEEMREATFSPTVSRFSHATGGKLAEYLDKGVESYALFVEMQKTLKEKRLQQLRQELDARGQEELTFRPVVHKAPPLIQEIAAEVRKAREASRGAPLSSARPTSVVTPFRF
jgi:hypothetical protein